MTTFNNAKADMLRRELGKLQCWLTGYHAGAGHKTGVLGGGIPGEDSVRQTRLLLEDLMRESAEQTPVMEPEKPQPVVEADGWITHEGKGMPVDGKTIVQYRCVDEYEGEDYASLLNDLGWWTYSDESKDADKVVAYKVLES